MSLITQVRWSLLLPLGLAAAATASEVPPRNPFLASSSYPVGHADSAQSDAVTQAGPRGLTRTLTPGEIDEARVGPGFFGASTSGPYSNGRRVFWANGLDRIVKIDHDSFEILATHRLAGVEPYTEQQADESISSFERSNEGVFAIATAFGEMMKFRNLSGVYTLLDRDNIYYIGDKNGAIAAWGDTDPSDPASEIEQKREIRLPAGVTGSMVGMNMTFDGWIVVATEHGYLVAIRRDFGALAQIRLRHSESAEERDETGGGWIRNSIAIDEDGGIYVASRDHMHKVIWRGGRFSTDPADGAWTARYPNGTGRGTGATPTLMGFGAEPRLVVISDGDAVMNMALFWREQIPAGWKAVLGAPDRRIAGLLPANMGDRSLTAVQSEQSVVVAGYGAAVVNNGPRNVPWYVPTRAVGTIAGLLGSNPEYQPYGVQKFEWDPAARRLREAWVNREVSSPNAVPIVSYGSQLLYTIGARKNRWTLEALDWKTGASAFHWVIGGQRYNSLFSATLIDEAGRIHYGGPWGRVRLSPRVAPK